MISCMKDGELFYINRLNDFEAVMDPTVYEALKQFCGDEFGDEAPAKVITKMECRIENLKEENDELEEKNGDLEDERDDLQEEVDDLKSQIRSLKDRFGTLKEKMQQAQGFIDKITDLAAALEDMQEEMNE